MEYSLLIEQSLLGSIQQHGVFARHLISHHRIVRETLRGTLYDVQIGKGWLHHYPVGALLYVCLYLLQSLVLGAIVHLVTSAVAEAWCRTSRITKRTVVGTGILG